jgi:hypothetical protein
MSAGDMWQSVLGQGGAVWGWFVAHLDADWLGPAVGEKSVALRVIRAQWCKCQDLQKVQVLVMSAGDMRQSLLGQ